MTETNNLTPDPKKNLKLLFTQELKHNQKPLQFNPDYSILKTSLIQIILMHAQ